MTMKKAKWAAIALMMAMTAGGMLTACSSSDNDDAVKPERIVAERIDVETLQTPREVTQLQHKKEEFLSNGDNQVLRSVGLTPFYVEKKNENGQNLITSLVAKVTLARIRRDSSLENTVLRALIFLCLTFIRNLVRLSLPPSQ